MIFFRTRHTRGIVLILRFLSRICSICPLLSRPTFCEKLLEFHRPVLYARLLHDKLKTSGKPSEEPSRGFLAAHFPAGTETLRNSNDVRAREEKVDI